MNLSQLQDLLNQFKQGAVAENDLISVLLQGPLAQSNLGFAMPDHHRELRQGFGEVVFGQNKTIEQLISIVGDLGRTGKPVLVTRVQEDKQKALCNRFPQGRSNTLGRTFLLNAPSEKKPDSENDVYDVGVVAAGTSDAYVVEEVREVLLAMSLSTNCILDVGVAGIHRLFNRLEDIRKCRVLICVAGMEAALPSVLGGLVSQPIIAVPTSVGYGTHFEGVTALLSMLNTCAPGITVVNVDNGFGAAFASHRILKGQRV